VRRRGVHALCFVDKGELVALDLRHQRDLVLLHRDLVVVDLALTLRGEISARSHRQSVGNETRGAGDDHRVVLLRRQCRANHAGDEPEVGREPVIETVHDIAKKAARLSPMPRLALLSRDSGECRRVFRRLLCKGQRFATARCSAGSRAMHVEIRLYLATLFLEKHRKEESRPEQLSDSREEASAPAWPKLLQCATMLRHQVTPDNYMAVLYRGQPRVNVLLSRIGLGSGENTIEVGRVSLILPMVLEGVEIGLRGVARRRFQHRRHSEISPEQPV